MPSADLVFQVFIIACSSIAKAALVIAAGVLLTRKGAFTPEALPIILIEVIGPELFGPDAAAAGVTYIGLYLIVYLILQWTIGANLLDVPSLTLGGGEARSKAPPSDSPVYASSSGTRPTDVELQAREDEGIAVSACTTSDASILQGVSARGNQCQPTGYWRRAGAVLRRVASPPIYGICAGLCIGLLPPLRWAFLSDPTTGHKPPLRFAMQAAGLLGSASIPLNTMLLGASLSKGPTWRVVPRRVVVGVVLTKLAFLPVVALAVCALMARLVRLPPLLLLVILMESAMPTANNLMMMCELAGGKANQLMSTLIFSEYLASPVLLTASLTAFMAFVQADAAAPVVAGVHEEQSNVTLAL